MRGESWEDLLSRSLEWTDSGADSVLLGAARSCKERWMSGSADCWALAGDVSPVIDELTRRPLRSTGQTGAPVPSNHRAVPRKRRVKKTSERSGRLVNGADVGKWLRGRADSITESGAVAAQTTGRFHSSSVIKTEGLLMHWWGVKCLWRVLSLCGFLFVLQGFSHCSEPGGPQSRRSVLLEAVHLTLAQINLQFQHVAVLFCSDHMLFCFSCFLAGAHLRVFCQQGHLVGSRTESPQRKWPKILT